MQLNVTSQQKRQVIDITSHVENLLKNNINREGACLIVVHHTTCALTTADLDPGTDLDFLDFLKAISPAVAYRHPHDPTHTADHIWASLIGPSLVLPFKDKKISLGTWQRIVLVELDGPRERRISITGLQLALN